MPEDVDNPNEPPEEVRKARPLERFLGVVIVCAFAGVTALAWVLVPDPSGIGTHTQLGLPPCGLYERLGVPCLTCGMTTAFAHMVRLQIASAFLANPLGVLIYLAFLGMALLNLHTLLTGWSFLGFLERLDWTWIGLGALIASLGSWAFKIVSVILS